MDPLSIPGCHHEQVTSVPAEHFMRHASGRHRTEGKPSTHDTRTYHRLSEGKFVELDGTSRRHQRVMSEETVPMENACHGVCLPASSPSWNGAAGVTKRASVGAVDTRGRQVRSSAAKDAHPRATSKMDSVCGSQRLLRDGCCHDVQYLHALECVGERIRYSLIHTARRTPPAETPNLGNPDPSQPASSLERTSHSEDQPLKI